MARKTQLTGRIRSIEVTDLYANLLGRSPDPQGLNSFVTFLETGGRIEAVEAMILGSPNALFVAAPLKLFICP
jgi:hypothetical protein